MRREALILLFLLLPLATARGQDPPPEGYDRIVSEDCLLDRRPRDASMGDAALALFHEARIDVERRLGAGLGAPPRVILAPTEGEFARLHRELTGNDPAEWVLAIAVPWKHVVLLKGSRLADGQNFLAPTLRHELAHLVNAAVATRGRHELPRWLDEGLAEYAESRTLTREEELELGGAARFGRLESFDSLATSFPAHTQKAERAYRMSLGFVAWLDETARAKGGVRALVAALDGGATVEQAIKNLTGFTPHEAEVEWKMDLAEKHSVAESLFRSSAFWWGLVSVLAILAFLRNAVVSRRTKKKLALADASEDRTEPGASDVVEHEKGTP
jgi:hypothetical protein